MGGTTLRDVLDFVLNRAGEDEIAVIVKAIRKRSESRYGEGLSALRLGEMSRQTASNIENQMGIGIESIRGMIREYAGEIIRKSAPELESAQVQELLESWVPKEPENGARESVPLLPPDALLTMVRQFIEYSTESMKITEKVKLAEEITDWPKVYWDRFPREVKELIAGYLNGKMTVTACWDALQEFVTSRY